MYLQFKKLNRRLCSYLFARIVFILVFSALFISYRKNNHSVGLSKSKLLIYWYIRKTGE